jgi:rhodanese-related sulfurtransferase
MKITHVLKALAALTLVKGALMAGIFSSYNYITAEETAKLMSEDASKVVIVDIQEKQGFEKEHLSGAQATYAYPVKTDAEKARLAELIPNIKPDQKVVIVCPRGAGGADRTYDFFLEKGLKKEQLFTLKNGQEGWPREKISDVIAK